MKRRTILSILSTVKDTSVLSLINQFQSTYPRWYVYKPIGIELEITSRCTICCEGCPIVNAGKKPKDILGDQDYLHVLTQAKKLGMISFSITGGEPFIYFDRVCTIISFHHGLDIFKLNTNASFFTTKARTKEYLQKLKACGFENNSSICSVLVISIGQQTIAGIPLINAVYATSLFHSIFDKEKSAIVINVTDKDERVIQRIYHEFLSLYENYTGTTYDEKSMPIRLFCLNSMDTLRRLKLLDEKQVSLRKQIQSFAPRYASGGCFNRMVKNTKDPLRAETLVPKCMVAPDGELFVCFGYDRVFSIGNLQTISLSDCVKKANNDPLLTTVLSKNLIGLYQYALRHNSSIKNMNVDTRYDPCDICKILRNAIVQQKKTKRNVCSV